MFLDKSADVVCNLFIQQTSNLCSLNFVQCLSIQMGFKHLLEDLKIFYHDASGALLSCMFSSAILHQLLPAM